MKTPSNNPLFSPYPLGDITVTNRLALAPLTRAKAGPERMPNMLMAEYYAQRAGAGLIIAEATTVSERGNGFRNSPGIYTQKQAQAWRLVTDAVHAKGGKMFLQLWHTGRASHSDFHHGELPVSASAIRLQGKEIHTPKGKKTHEVPRALETDEIPAVIADYVNASQRAHFAGFDGVEIHAANGYLLDQFLQSKTNHRQDQYGGSVENRFRLLREIVEGVSEELGSQKVAVRFSPNGGGNDMGYHDFRETFSYAAKELSSYSLAYLHVLDGLAFGFHELGEPMTLEDFRAVYDGTLMANCGYHRQTAIDAVQRGAADMVAIGRPYISNPDLAERWQNNWPEAPVSDPSSWYTLEQEAAGYTDFPTYSESVESCPPA
ncbi:MAG: alkene reductase [Planctomycetes bacterium]|nr:alkene reductase [Planctomycetota bacterium]